MARLSGERGLVAPKACGGQTGGMATPESIAVLRIELADIEPLIWRRVAVRTSMNLKAVHSVIQAAMGWLDYHLWEFTANEHKYGMLLPDDPDWNGRIKNAATTKLSALLTGGVREIEYVYDIGDNWQHRVIIEKLKAAEPGVTYPRFLGGERRCPPEDCGGYPGTTTFLTTSPANRARSEKPRSIGSARGMTRMRSASRKSSPPLAASLLRRAHRDENQVTDFGGREVVIGLGWGWAASRAAANPRA